MRSFIKVALFFAVNGLAIKYPYDGAHYGNWPGENGVSCYAHYAFPASELDKLIAATEPVNQDAYPDVEYLSPWGFVHPSYGNEAINARIKFVFRQFGDIEGETTLDALEIIADLGAVRYMKLVCSDVLICPGNRRLHLVENRKTESVSKSINVIKCTSLS